jgi:hypothetical protein
MSKSLPPRHSGRDRCLARTAGPALAWSRRPDPIFAAIEANRAAIAAHLASNAQGALEVRLVDERIAEAGSPQNARMHSTRPYAQRNRIRCMSKPQGLR